MIQRIQSLYLLLASLVMISTAFLPWVTYYAGETTVTLHAMSDSEFILGWPLAFIIAMTFAVQLVSIFQYKNRKMQMRTVSLSIWLSVLTYLVFLGAHYYDVKQLSAIDAVHLDYEFALALPIVSAILAWMGKKAIKKDDDLVRSVDRLR